MGPHVRPEAILLDLMMPIMDGWAFLRARREPRLAGEVSVDMRDAEVGPDLEAEVSLPVIAASAPAALRL